MQKVTPRTSCHPESTRVESTVTHGLDPWSQMLTPAGKRLLALLPEAVEGVRGLVVSC